MSISFTDEDLTSFQRLHEERYGEKITREQAYISGMALVGLLEVIVLNDD